MCWCCIAQPIISILLFFSVPLENVSSTLAQTYTDTLKWSQNSLGRLLFNVVCLYAYVL